MMQRALATGGTALKWEEGRKVLIVVFKGGKVMGTSARNLDGGGGAPAAGKEMSREDLAKVLEDVKGTDKDRRKGACERLAAAQPGEGRKEVVETLTALLTDPDLFTRMAALKAHVAWADKDGVSTYYDLLKADKDFPSRAILIEALAKLDGARAAEAIAARLTDGADRGAANKALKAIGPDAEKAVLPYLASPDFNTRIAACQVLEQIGTSASVEALKKAADGLDGNLAPGVNRAADKAIAAISARK
jgi:HEAT repeat protein